MSNCITPFSLKDAPALIEQLLPVQKLSVEAYKEQMAGSGKTLTALGSYWKGRKPLILNKACILGCLLPATDDPARDLEIFEKLMAMDDESFVARWKRRPRPKEILATLSIARIADYFTVEPEGVLLAAAPVDWSKPEYATVKVAWHADCSELERRRLEAQMLPKAPYRERVDQAQRPEEVMDTVHDHIWDAVNDHLGTSAHSFPELVEQLGIMRFGHRPRVADTFCGSGQIPFEAARLGCDVYASDLFLRPDMPIYPIESSTRVVNSAAFEVREQADVFVTDPPYGDAIKYEEILDFFIAWLRKNPLPEFADWVWDSRRSLAIKGEDEDFRRCMVAAYKRMTECMPDNGIQVIMFTHQNGSIWGDMANIVWASGLQVTAAWYVATETDSALRAGTHVKGTVLLVCRKRQGSLKTTRDDLAWELQEEVEAQVHALTGLNQEARGLYRDENVFEDADLQMVGYAAALRVLTRYAIIDGRDMTTEAIHPRVRGETTFVDGLIAFAVDTANQCLVPAGIAKVHWDGLSGAERFYLKLVDLEAKGLKTLDNYQNFAKAFKVRNFRALMASQKANQARLKSAVEFGKTEMSDSSELHQSVLRAVLYAMMELVKNVDGSEVLAHLTLNVPDYYANQTQRDRVVELADYLARQLETQRPDEASAARVLRELVKHQRLG